MRESYVYPTVGTKERSDKNDIEQAIRVMSDRETEEREKEKKEVERH